MDHTGYLALIFRFHRDTVTTISHGNHCVLQIRAGGTIYHACKLCMNSFTRNLHGTADLFQRTAGIITDFIFRQDTAANLTGQIGQRLQSVK